MTEPKVLIAIPMLRYVDAQFFGSFFRMKTNGNCGMGIEVDSLVYNARNKLTVKAIDGGYDYIFWLDSDMVFDPDILLNLLEDAKQGMDFITGLCFKRSYPIIPTILKELHWKQEKDQIDHGCEFYKDYPKDQVFEIAGGGLACTLVKTSLMTDIARYFTMSPFTPLPQMGEDYSFCWRLGRVGKKMYCDSRVKVGHIGTQIFNEELYELQENKNE